MKLVYTGLLILAVSAVALADILLKKAAGLESLTAALKSPWIFVAVALYLFQIFFFLYVFVHGADLIYVGVLQTALYAVIVVGAGFLIFGETLSFVHGVGIIFAIVGVILINI